MKPKVHIVIPASGLGTRFNNTEFYELKPFIKFFDKTMFEHIINNVMDINFNVRISILILEKFKEQYFQDIKYLEKKYPVTFYYTPKLSEGTTATALYIYSLLDNNDFTLLMNCDQIVDIKLGDYIKKHNELNSDGSLLCFTGEDSKKWSFVEEHDSKITRVVAKDNISDVAVCGWYAWSKGKDFIKYGIQQIINQDKVNGEYYLCPVYNYAIKDGKNISCIKISKDKMHGVGTPEDLREFIRTRNNS